MKLPGHRELLPRARKTAARRLQQREIWKKRAGRHHTRHGAGSCCCCCHGHQTKNFATQNPEKQKTQKHKHTHTHTDRSLRIFFFFFFSSKKNKILNKLFVSRFTRCLRQCKSEEATANTRSWASSLLLLAAWSSSHCCNNQLLLLLLLLVGISEYSNYNTFQEATSFPHTLICWKKKMRNKKLQTQILHRIRDEEHHQKKNYKNLQKFSNTLFWDTKTVWEKDLERERTRRWCDSTNKQASKQRRKGFVEFANKFCREEGKRGRKKKERDEGFGIFWGYLFLISNIHLSCGPGFSFLFF